MTLLKISDEKLDQSLGLLMKACNADVIEKIVPLAHALSQGGDDNELIENLKNDGKAFQTSANSFKEKVDSLIATIGSLYDISAWMKKQAGGGNVKAQDLSGSVQAIDASSVIQ